MDDGAVLASLAEVLPPDDTAWVAEGPLREQQMLNERAAVMFQAYIMELSKNAKTRILMPELVQPKAAPQL